MSENQHIERGIGIGIVVLTVGSVLILLYSIYAGVFSEPKPLLNTFTITKSPMQIVYKGIRDEDILPIVKVVGSTEFEPYNFNSDTNVRIVTETTDSVEQASIPVTRQQIAEVLGKDLNVSNVKH